MVLLKSFARFIAELLLNSAPPAAANTFFAGKLKSNEASALIEGGKGRSLVRLQILPAHSPWGVECTEAFV